VLRKDFMYDPYQVAEARAAGADCILIIMAAIDDATAAELEAAAFAHTMDVLVEVHDEKELERALKISPALIGVNNRDLKGKFDTDLSTTERLAKKLFPSLVTRHSSLLVAESGIHSRADVERLKKYGAKAILVGESLMKNGDIKTKIRELIG